LEKSELRNALVKVQMLYDERPALKSPIINISLSLKGISL
jgi:hypothetical protein